MGNDRLDSFGARSELTFAGGTVSYFRLDRLAAARVADVSRLPVSIRLLLEALLRGENGREVTADDVTALAKYDPAAPGAIEVPFHPARVLMQDFTGVPCIVDLAAMRDAMQRLGGDPARINPVIPVDLVIDHSVQVDAYGSPDALRRNAELEFERNRERYEFLRWAQAAFRDFRVIPPASGICHQVNLEHLASVVALRDAGDGPVAFPDSCVGTDSHTPMVNGAGVLGWGVGGIEAEAALLGQPVFLLAPTVVGVRLRGALPPQATATDLVLALTEILRRRGVVGSFVEFFGPGLDGLSVPDRATVSNMAPEYGATVGFFPVDDNTLRYLRETARPPERIDLVERYAKEQGLFRSFETPDPVFHDTLEFDLDSVEPSLAGPRRPQDRIALAGMKAHWEAALRTPIEKRGFGMDAAAAARRSTVALPGSTVELAHGAVGLAAITSCTNTSNPSVMLAAGLLARKAVEAGLSVRPWVKTSLAPGSKVVTRYFERAGLTPFLERLGFHTVGYGCTTCIGNSGPMPEPLATAVERDGLVVAAVLSGNRNFDGRINPHARASYLASPPLVVAYALAGRVDFDFDHEPLGKRSDGRPVFLRDLWPSHAEVAALVPLAVEAEGFDAAYRGIDRSNEEWNRIATPAGASYAWSDASTYIREPPFFTGLTLRPAPIRPIEGARVLVVVGDSVTTDHISPAGSIAKDSPAGRYLREHGVQPADFNSYGSRRGNDRVMARGTFANIRLRNLLAPGTEGGVTIHLPSGEPVSIFEAARRYREAGTPTVVLAGKDYGMGSSRDWAAKGTLLLGVRAVLAESFERIHRGNLVGMGVLPLEFPAGTTRAGLGLDGTETFRIAVGDDVAPRSTVRVEAVRSDGTTAAFDARCRLDAPIEVSYYRHGGILPAVLRGFLSP
ncbi:MAG: aconitate hydratase AcnA [Deltaproteobacteria bacterium]|nr:aconitate hydratase AcnA [Deltaproteobacteria bacterium]